MEWVGWCGSDTGKLTSGYLPLFILKQIQPYQDRWDQKKRLLANEKRNMVNLPAQKHEQQFLIRVYLGDSTGQPLKPRVMRFMRISPDAQLAQLPLLFSSVFRSSSHPIKPGDCVVFWKGYQLSAYNSSSFASGQCS